MSKEELELVVPTKEYQKEVEEYLQEFIKYGENRIAGIGGLDKLKDFNLWLEKVQNDMSSKTINEERGICNRANQISFKKMQRTWNR